MTALFTAPTPAQTFVQTFARTPAMPVPVTLEARLAARWATRPLRTVVLGCGVVGGGVIEHLPHPLVLTAILARRARPEGALLAPVFTDADAVFATRPDLVIEALPGGPEAEALLARAVAQGCHVISANKDVAARRPDLIRDARAHGRVFAHSAAVGGGAPVLETVARLAASGAGIARVRGVLNGTSNFVLDRLRAGQSLKHAVAAAQAAGFAEADPSADLDGLDAANKLVLIAREAWGVSLDPASIVRESISHLPASAAASAARQSRRLRQVAVLERAGARIGARVRLEALPETDALARTRDEGNCVVLSPQRGAQVIVAGKGAGRAPTAASMLGDVHRLIAAVCA
jgi:homoserine dehydrogenase